MAWYRRRDLRIRHVFRFPDKSIEFDGPVRADRAKAGEAPAEMAGEVGGVAEPDCGMRMVEAMHARPLFHKQAGATVTAIDDESGDGATSDQPIQDASDVRSVALIPLRPTSA